MLASLPFMAQESTSVFNFLSLPASSHATALGGKNISLIEDDASLAFQNPALIANTSNNSINFNFMTYMRGTKTGSLAYTRAHGERGTWGLTTQFVGYGKMTETNAQGDILGDTKGLDFCLGGMYSYCLGEHWVGGATGKFIYSNYAHYTSVAMAVDLGLNYYDEEKDLSFSAVAMNLGGQMKAFGDTHERLPFDLELGLSKGIAHAPIRINATMTDLTHWNKKYYYSPTGKIKGGNILINHFNLGVDIKPMDMFYVSLGYNMRRGYEMKAAGKSHAAGLTCGAGLMLKRIKFGIAYAKYHVSAPTLAFSFSTRI